MADLDYLQPEERDAERRAMSRLRPVERRHKNRRGWRLREIARMRTNKDTDDRVRKED